MSKGFTLLENCQITFQAWKLGCGVNMWFRDQMSKLLPALLPEVLPITLFQQLSDFTHPTAHVGSTHPTAHAGDHFSD